MAVGWKSLAGIVSAASVVCVGTLYSVLVREPSAVPPPAPQTSAAPDTKPASPLVASNPSTADAQKPQQAPAGQDQAAVKPATSGADAPQAGTPNPDQAKPPGDPATPAGNQAKPDNSKPGAQAADPSQPAKGQVLPTFDVARIEPGGDAVIAGRAAPGATVELLRNGTTYARAVADVGGQWAIVPPTLPKGPCELTLRTTSPDGRVAQSEQTVSVRVPEQPGEEVVIVLNAPDQPSKVLTDATRPAGQLVANSQVAAAPPTQGVPAGNGPTVATPSAPTPNTPKTNAGNTPSRANASIRTVEADEAGRFFVTGMAEPGSTLRIYLNDTLVTTVTAAKDGSFGMTIEKGMAPGDYHVRVDDVAAGSGKVLTRAEVPFAMAEKAPGTSAPAVVAAASTKSVRPMASATDVSTTGGKTEPAATAAPSQGASPAAVPQADAANTSGIAALTTQPSGGSPTVAPADGTVTRSAQTPAATTQAGPGAQPVQVGEAKPAAATPPPSVAVIPEIRTTTIVQGDNLWRISRKIYGQGIRYTWIYDANTDQIRNPNLIYPGQIFVMPEKKEP
jgi:nucleoid-associated protein YgaU